MKAFFLFLWLPFCLIGKPVLPEREPWPPFVSGDAFRSFCDYIFDETDRSVNPRKVAARSSIFVKTDYLEEFFTRIHPNIPHPYVLVTHNSDYSVPGNWAGFLEDKKLLAWFAQNPDRIHAKLHPIPIGIANRRWAHGNGSCIQQVQNQQLKKKNFLYLNIAVESYPQERRVVADHFKNSSFVSSSLPTSFMQYLTDIASSSFVAAPRGNGLDTHRFWESLYLGAYPIVKSSPLDPLYEGLPVVVVQNWNEVTEEFLKTKYREFQATQFNLEKLYIDYWRFLIQSYKNPS